MPAAGVDHVKVGGVLSGNTFNNLSLGGLTRDGRPACNRLEELILEAAIKGQAEAIVTHNARDFYPAFRMFGIPVKSPAQVLKELSK
jgi:hypothetical protein